MFLLGLDAKRDWAVLVPFKLESDGVTFTILAASVVGAGSCTSHWFIKTFKSAVETMRCRVPSGPIMMICPSFVQHFETPKHCLAAMNALWRFLVRNSDSVMPVFFKLVLEYQILFRNPKSLPHFTSSQAAQALASTDSSALQLRNLDMIGQGFDCGWRCILISCLRYTVY